MVNLKSIEIFTDGSCLGNPGPGGYGVVLKYQQHIKELSGGYQLTTNNRMELMAAIAALECLKEPCQIDLSTDSQYVRQGIMQWLHNWKRNNWRTSNKEPVKNKDLWQRLDAACQQQQRPQHPRRQPDQVSPHLPLPLEGEIEEFGRRDREGPHQRQAGHHPQRRAEGQGRPPAR